MNDSDTKQMPIASYFKVEEYIVGTYQEAQAVADKVFAPYGKVGNSGSRTSESAKVRIRRRRSCNNKADSFRVVLYHHVSKREAKKPRPEAEATEAPKKRLRQRNDRKGRRRNSHERTAI